MIKAPLSISNSNGYGAHNGVAIEDRTGLVCAIAIGDVPALDADEMARLIAAAPDLLAMLKHAVHWHDQLTPADIGRYAAAIAKATDAA